MAAFRTDFGTDIGPACGCQCSQTPGEGIWGYELQGDGTIKARCVLCGHEESLKRPTTCTNPLTVKDIRETHEATRKVESWYGVPKHVCQEV